MEIEDFIEQDILVYLDRVLAEDHREDDAHAADQVSTVFLNRDYEEELDAALADGNLVKAKHVLHDLKAKMDETPDSGKAQVKDLLARLYEHFKEAVESGAPRKPLEHPPAPPAEAPPLPPPTYARVPAQAPVAVSPGAPPAPTAAPATASSAVPAAPSPPSPSRSILPSDSRAQIPAKPLAAPLPVATAPSVPDPATVALDEADRLLASGDLPGAIKAFRRGKASLLAMESGVPTPIVQRYRSMYDRLKEEHARRTARPVPPAISALDKDLLLQLEREKRSLDTQLHAHDIKGAMATYRVMRMLAQQIHDGKTAEDAARKMVRIHQIITALMPRRRP